MSDLHEGEHRFVDGRVDHLTAPGPPTVMESHQPAQRAQGSGQGIPDADPHPAGRGPGIAGYVPEPPHGLADGAVTRLPRVGPGLPEAGHPDQDDPGVRRGEPVVSEVPTLQGSRSEVLHHHVAPSDEVAGHPLSGLGPEVERHGFLVAGNDGEPE